jgi:hypothetical protein
MGSSKYFGIRYLFSFLHPYSKGDLIIVEKQRGQGKYNTVFSSSITVSEAIHAANNLKAELKFTELETSFENTQSKSVR